MSESRNVSVGQSNSRGKIDVAAELAAVDRGIEAVGEPVAIEALRAILLGDDLRAVAGLQECAQAAGVVDVAVRVDGGMERRVAPRAHGAMHLLAQAMQTRVDQHESHVRLERVGVGERACMSTSGATSSGGAEKIAVAWRGSCVTIEEEDWVIGGLAVRASLATIVRMLSARLQRCEASLETSTDGARRCLDM